MLKVLLLAISLMVTGCVAGPDYHIPDSAVANMAAEGQDFIGARSAAFSRAPLPNHWWRLYDDARLDAYIGEALRANTDLRAADSNIAQASLAIQEIQASRTPAATVGACGTYDSSSGCTLKQSIDGPSYSVGVSVSYPLDLAGGIRRAIEQAHAKSEAVEAVRDNLRLTVAAAVARNYVGVCAANRALAAMQRVLAIQDKTLSATERLFQGGRGTAFDVTRAQAAVDQSAANIPPFIARRQAALFAIAALMGRPASAYPHELEDCASALNIDQPIPVGDGTALIRRRPDIRAAERNLAQATAAIGIEVAQLYPQVSLGGAISMAGPPRKWGGSVGPILSWTWPNRALARARIGEAGAAADTASAQFDGVVLTALQETESALSTYARAIDRTRELIVARDNAAKAAGQADRLFRFGRTDILNVLQAQASLSSAEADLATAQATLADDQINVFLALGGGWES